MALTTLEESTLQRFRTGVAMIESDGSTDGWISFALTMVLECAEMTRRERFSRGPGTVDFKDDRSPTIRLETEVEELIRRRLSRFMPDAAMVGEETGGEVTESGFSLAVDPIDGTWAFVNDTGSYAISMAVFRDGDPILGFVANPTTGEIGYTTGEASARLIGLSMFRDEDIGLRLPSQPVSQDSILVNLHPSRKGGEVANALNTAWRRRDIRMVRSVGGSLSWGLVEAAKGAFVYANLWAWQPAPYDLAAGTLIVRAAGGDVTDLEQRPIDMLHHTGPFVAGITDESRETVSGLLRGVPSIGTT